MIKSALTKGATTCALVLAIIMSLPAQFASAADDVTDGSASTFGSTQIRVSMNFDNTNCDKNSTNNCSGLNGADLDYIVVAGSVCLKQIGVTNVPVDLDIYGDNKTDYVRTVTVNFVYKGIVNSSPTWRADLANTQGDIVRARLRGTVTAWNPSPSNHAWICPTTTPVSFSSGGLNPYGKAQ